MQQFKKKNFNLKNLTVFLVDQKLPNQWNFADVQRELEALLTHILDLFLINLLRQFFCLRKFQNHFR